MSSFLISQFECLFIAARSTETKIDSDSGTEKSDESKDTDDVWKKLKDFAG